MTTLDSEYLELAKPMNHADVIYLGPAFPHLPDYALHLLDGHWRVGFILQPHNWAAARLIPHHTVKCHHCSGRSSQEALLQARLVDRLASDFADVHGYEGAVKEQLLRRLVERWRRCRLHEGDDLLWRVPR